MSKQDWISNIFINYHHHHHHHRHHHHHHHHPDDADDGDDIYDECDDDDAPPLLHKRKYPDRMSLFIFLKSLIEVFASVEDTGNIIGRLSIDVFRSIHYRLHF